MKSPTLNKPLSSEGSALWKMAQVAAVLTTGLLLAGLVYLPETTLKIAWFGIVPLLPASFLVNAGLWRGICPIATANMLVAPSLGPKLPPGYTATLNSMGMILLVLLIPARRLLLNQHALVLAGTLTAIVLAALVLGRLFRSKAGFCNAVCPILPVEKLYGQAPLVWVRNPRCVPCNVCTTTGCMDRDQSGAIARRNGSGTGRKWAFSPMGLFSAAFPGLIFGYFQTQDSSLTEWASVYATALLPAAASLVIFGGMVFAANIKARQAGPVLGAIAVATYYWFAGPASAEAFGLPEMLGVSIRWGLLAVTAFWLARALRPMMSRKTV